MDLPGIICISPKDGEGIERAARVLGSAFAEEPWFIEWSSALDELGTADERKHGIIREHIRGDLHAHAPHKAVYATDDFAGVAGCYLASEFAGADHAALEEEGYASYLAGYLSDDEERVLEAKSRAMEAISDFSWAADAAKEDFAAGLTSSDDHIYIYAWAVDAAKRGTGAFRRLADPIISYADEHGINCYLDCFSENLESLYRHMGFEVLMEKRCAGLDIYERCMVHRPRRG